MDSAECLFPSRFPASSHWPIHFREQYLRRPFLAHAGGHSNGVPHAKHVNLTHPVFRTFARLILWFNPTHTWLQNRRFAILLGIPLNSVPHCSQFFSRTKMGMDGDDNFSRCVMPQSIPLIFAVDKKDVGRPSASGLEFDHRVTNARPVMRPIFSPIVFQGVKSLPAPPRAPRSPDATGPDVEPSRARLERLSDHCGLGKGFPEEEHEPDVRPRKHDDHGVPKLHADEPTD